MSHRSHSNRKRNTFHLSYLSSLSNSSKIACRVSHHTCPSLFHPITRRSKEHPSVCELGTLDNELCALDGIKTAAFQRCYLLLRLMAQMCSSWKWQAESEESNSLLLRHCPQLPREFIIITLALCHTAASKVSINGILLLLWSAGL